MFFPDSYRVLKVWKNSICICSLAFDKLNIINQQHIGITIFTAEIIVFIFLDGVNKLIDKVFALEHTEHFCWIDGT